MAVSTGAKLAAGGTAFVAAGTPASVYIAKDYIFLYEVEREVINKDLKLTAAGPSNVDNKITISVSVSTEQEPKLSTGYSWSCEITTEPNPPSETIDTNLVTKIQNNLFKSNENITEEQRKNKELLVRACSQDRKDTPSNTSVKGSLILEKKADQSSFSFKNHPELNSLLEATN